MMYWGDGISGWAMLLMIVSTLLFWGLLIAGIVALVRYVGRSGPPAGSATHVTTETANAQRILAERFARGEIDQEEYSRRLGVLADTARIPARG